MKAKHRRRLYARHCARKVVYRSMAEAAWAAARGDDGLEPYRCPMGPHYHVGHGSKLPGYVVHLQPGPHLEDVGIASYGLAPDAEPTQILDGPAPTLPSRPRLRRAVQVIAADLGLALVIVLAPVVALELLH